LDSGLMLMSGGYCVVQWSAEASGLWSCQTIRVSRVPASIYKQSYNSVVSATGTAAWWRVLRACSGYVELRV